MGASERSSRDKKMAAYLKDRGVTRNTGSCPMGCGRSLANGGPALLAHLANCPGARRHDSRTKYAK